MSRPTRGTPAGDAYLDLQNQARRTRRSTQELLQLYVLEGFLARLAYSDAKDSLVLKGGVLLAAFGSRRPTKDVDLAAVDLAGDLETVFQLIRTVLTLEPDPDDGIVFNVATATAEAIREDDEYAGVRVHAQARLASAELPFHVDVNIGDPIWPAPEIVNIPRIRGGKAIKLRGYPIHMVLAEKIVTAIQRGTANTRWRDFGDIWTLSRQHPIGANDLERAITVVVGYRSATLRPLAQTLAGYAERSQSRWAGWRRRSNSTHLPDQFAPVVEHVTAFADPVLIGDATDKHWNPESSTWDPWNLAGLDAMTKAVAPEIEAGLFG